MYIVSLFVFVLGQKFTFCNSGVFSPLHLSYTPIQDLGEYVFEWMSKYTKKKRLTQLRLNDPYEIL